MRRSATNTWIREGSSEVWIDETDRPIPNLVCVCLSLSLSVFLYTRVCYSWFLFLRSTSGYDEEAGRKQSVHRQAEWDEKYHTCTSRAISPVAVSVHDSSRKPQQGSGTRRDSYRRRVDSPLGHWPLAGLAGSVNHPVGRCL